MRFRLAFSLLLACLVSSSSLAQTWQAYPAYRDVRAVASSADAVWAATPAGIFAVSTADGAIERYTTIDGLTGGEVQALAVDDNGRVWAGYADGTLDRIDPASGEVRSFFDIKRADQYTSRGVTRIRPRGQNLLIGTDFGLVTWDLARDEVRQTASRLGPLPAATPVQDVIVAPAPDGTGEFFWLATDEGVVRASTDSPNLQIPSAWVRDEGFTGESFSLAFYEGTVWAGGRPARGEPRDMYRRDPSGDWQRQFFIDEVLPDLVVTGNVLAALDEGGSRVFLYQLGAPLRVLNAAPEAARHQSLTLGPDGRLWVGDGGVGLFQQPEIPSAEGTTTVVPAPQVPSGPLANSIASIDIARDGRIWTAANSIAIGSAGASGVSWFDDGVWTTLRTDQSALPLSSFQSIVARPEGGALAGTDGKGLAVIEEDGSVAVFDPSNSSLRPASGDVNVVISDMVREGDLWWVVNKSSPLPLHSFPGTASATRDDWNGLPPPPGSPLGVPADDIALDGFGQKWLAMGPQGLLAWDTGSDPLSPADDRGRVFNVGANGQGLPNGNVTSVVRDREGRMWIGTRRGLAVVFSPGSAFGSDPALAQPVVPTTELADGSLDFLLRDADVRALAVDPAGRIWVGTSSGAFLLNAEGDGIQLRLTADATPLPSDDILDIAIDARTGLVYFVTENGLYSYKGDATGPDLASEELRLSPNPYRPASGARITIGGINAPTSRVRVLTLDGRVVFESDSVFGGSFQWDGRDARDGDLVPSGVYLVAASGANGERTIYGKIAVLR